MENITRIEKEILEGESSITEFISVDSLFNNPTLVPSDVV